MSVLQVLRGRQLLSWSERGLYLITTLAFVFLFVPIVAAVVYSFNAGVDGRQTAQFTGFSTRAYPQLVESPTISAAIADSAVSSIFAALIATALGVVAGLAQVRARSHVVRRVLTAVLAAVLLVPELVVAVALLQFFSVTHATLSMATMVAGLTTFPTAVVALIVRSRVVVLDGSVEEAAADLGARPLEVFRDVTMPQLRPAVIAGLILSFTFSFDNLITASMLSTPTVNTLTVYLFASIEHGGVTAVGYAVAACMLVFTLSMLAVAGLIYRHEARKLGASGSLVDAAAGHGAPAPQPA
ncbi:MAG: ABC transporter permease [Patulibacter sp.]